MKQITTVYLEQIDKEFIDKNHLNLSKVVRDKIEELRLGIDYKENCAKLSSLTQKLLEGLDKEKK